MYFEQFDSDRETVLTACREAGVAWIIEVGTNLETSKQALQLARQHGGSAAVGFHPHEAANVQNGDWAKLMRLLIEPDVVALGEIGLDYHYPEPPKEVQSIVFRRQIHMALGLEIPVIIHNREADDDVLRTIQEEGEGRLEGVLHCFNSDWSVAEAAMQLGLYIGIGGIVTFRNAKTLHEVVRKLPLERIILETDAPFLAPHPYRGKRNDSSMIPVIGAAVAELKGISVEDVARVTTDNARRLFRLYEWDNV